MIYIRFKVFLALLLSVTMISRTECHPNEIEDHCIYRWTNKPIKPLQAESLLSSKILVMSSLVVLDLQCSRLSCQQAPWSPKCHSNEWDDQTLQSLLTSKVQVMVISSPPRIELCSVSNIRETNPEWPFRFQGGRLVHWLLARRIRRGSDQRQSEYEYEDTDVFTVIFSCKS